MLILGGILRGIMTTLDLILKGLNKKVEPVIVDTEVEDFMPFDEAFEVVNNEWAELHELLANEWAGLSFRKRESFLLSEDELYRIVLRHLNSDEISLRKLPRFVYVLNALEVPVKGIGDVFYYDSFQRILAEIIYRIAQAQAFPDCNKRIAWDCGLIIVTKARFKINSSSVEVKKVLDALVDELSVEDFSDWLGLTLQKIP